MRNLKSLALLTLLFSLSLVVFAETSNDATQAKEDIKPSTEATDAVEPQQRGRGGCKYGCCGAYAYGQCAACCSRPQSTETKVEENDVVVEPQALKTETVEVNDVEPEQRGFGGGGWGGCKFGCCGGWRYGRCNYCCARPEAEAEAVEPQALEAETVEANVVEPEQRGFGGGGWGGCKFGCCGGWRYGRCNYCCARPQAEAEAVEPQALEAETVEANVVEPEQRGFGGGGWGGCKFGCCGGWRYGRCNYCCARPRAETDVVEPQQRRGCRYGCCGSYAYGQCSACCPRKMATEEDKKKEEAKP